MITTTTRPGLTEAQRYLGERTLVWLQEHPGRHNQDCWTYDPDDALGDPPPGTDPTEELCNTTLCVAGTVVALAYGARAEYHAGYVKLPDRPGDRVPYDVVAYELLGGDPKALHRAFMTSSPQDALEDLRQFIDADGWPNGYGEE